MEVEAKLLISSISNVNALTLSLNINKVGVKSGLIQVSRIHFETIMLFVHVGWTIKFIC